MIAPLILAALTAFPNAHRPVETTIPQAQADFDRGLSLLYAYNGDDAYGAFAQALAADPHLAMAAWGEALASGTDLNTPLDATRFARASEAAQRANALSGYARGDDAQLIAAVAQRYAGDYAQRDAGEARYRAMMLQIAAANPQDDDAATLDAEALMEHAGTDRLWTDGGTVAAPDTVTVLALLNRVLARNPDHVFANHLCMHAYDYAKSRGPALVCADRVASWHLAPGQEHLAHMPAHTYIETGQYERAVQVSEYAWQLRERWGGHKYAEHDAYTGWSAAMMLGDAAVAQAWAARAGEAYGGSDLWATWARFRQWDYIAHSSASGEFFAPLSRGLTDVHFGLLQDARNMAALMGKSDSDYRWILQAAIDEHVSGTATAAEDLRHAQADQDRDYGGETIPLFPAGEMLGALYYRHGSYDDAVTAFRETLSRFPQDPRALYGLGQAQKALGQTSDARATLKTFEQIWTQADPPDLADL